ncbi:small subunit processome component 20 [Acrasis kona]|uniref:Small subunit processome component 20 n=1 Tax=Acrasis kona TaxID=1008807 RepID=A0AAW2ZTR7_9EUKA
MPLTKLSSQDVENFIDTLEFKIKQVQREAPSTYQTNPTEQAKVLGSFNRPEVKLPFVGGKLALQYSALMNPVKEDLRLWRGELTDLCTTHLYLGVSGAGKTHSIVEYGTQGYILFYTAAERTQDKDLYYCAMRDSIIHFETETHNEEDTKDMKKDKDGRSFIRFCLLVKAVVLLHLLKTYPNMTPDMFFCDQLNGKSNYYVQCLKKVRNEVADFSSEDICEYFGHVTTRIRELDIVKKYKGRVGIAFDECNEMTKTLETHFLSQNDKTHRPLYSAIINETNKLSLYFDYIAVAGTAISLKKKELTESAIGKDHLTVLLEFPFLHSGDSVSLLKDYLDLSNCGDVLNVDKSTELYDINGRARSTTKVVNLIAEHKKDGTKEAILAECLRGACNLQVEDLVDALKDKIAAADDHKKKTDGRYDCKSLRRTGGAQQ